MKNLTVFIVIIVIALLNTSIQSNDTIPSGSIECYVCNDCPKVSINTPSKLCQPPVNGDSQHCLIYMERIIIMKRRHPLVIRGCTSERGTCAEIAEIDHMHNDVLELVSCEECSTNNCNTSNGVNKLHANLTIIFIVILISIIPLYFFFCNILYPQLKIKKYHTGLFHA